MCALCRIYASHDLMQHGIQMPSVQYHVSEWIRETIYGARLWKVSFVFIYTMHSMKVFAKLVVRKNCLTAMGEWGCSVVGAAQRTSEKGTPPKPVPVTRPVTGLQYGLFLSDGLFIKNDLRCGSGNVLAVDTPLIFSFSFPYGFSQIILLAYLSLPIYKRRIGNL